MKVIITSCEQLNIILQSMIKPGIEVISIGDEIDSSNIDEVLVLISHYNPATLMQIRASLADKVTKDCLIKLVII